MRRLPRGVFVILGVIILASVCLWYLNLQLSKPSVGVIYEKAAAQEEAVATPPVKNVKNVGNFASFETRSDFQKRRPDIVALPVIERFSFVRPTTPVWALNITISKLPSNNLNDDGSYNYRVRSLEYEESQLTVDENRSYSIMTNTTSSGYDKTAFILFDGHVAAVSLNSSYGGDTETLDKIFSDLLKSWQWRLKV